MLFLSLKFHLGFQNGTLCSCLFGRLRFSLRVDLVSCSSLVAALSEWGLFYKWGFYVGLWKLDVFWLRCLINLFLFMFSVELSILEFVAICHFRVRLKLKVEFLGGLCWELALFFLIFKHELYVVCFRIENKIFDRYLGNSPYFEH